MINKKKYIYSINEQKINKNNIFLFLSIKIINIYYGLYLSNNIKNIINLLYKK